MDSAQAVGLTLTTVGTAAGLFSQVLPSAGSLAAAPATPESEAYVRRRATSAAVVVGAIGGGAALLAGSPWPAIGAAAVAGFLWWQYIDAARMDEVMR